MAILLLIFVTIILFWKGSGLPIKIVYLGNAQSSLAVAVTSPFHYYFTVDGVLEEMGSMNESSSPYWWLNSGGQMWLIGGTGRIIFKELPAYSKWRLAYALSNPADTDDGYHPQNIFRMLTRSKWRNFRQEIYFNFIIRWRNQRFFRGNMIKIQIQHYCRLASG